MKTISTKKAMLISSAFMMASATVSAQISGVTGLEGINNNCIEASGILVEADDNKIDHRK